MKTNLVQLRNGVPTTTSLQIALAFGKNHGHILRDIKSLECSKSFQESNFGLSFYIRDLPNGGSKKEPLYYMTRDGFTFLVMGFTGKVAAKFKEDYINAFNQMEASIRKSGIDERIILMQMQEYFDRRNQKWNTYLKELAKETGVRIGFLCDIPSAVKIHPEWGLQKNIEYIMPILSNGITEAWAAMYHYLQTKRENEAIRADAQKAITDLAHKYRIYPEAR